MVVTDTATHRQTHENSSGVFNAINHVSNVGFFSNGTPFVRRDMTAIVSRCNQIIVGVIGKQIPCKLFDSKLIEAHVLVE